MNIKLTPLDHQFLSRMGAKVLPESVTIDDIAFGQYKLEVRRQFPRYLSEHIHAHALARVIHIHHGHVIAPIDVPSVAPNVPPVSVRPVEHHIHHSHAHRLTWWQIGLLIVVMILCSAVLARCQVDVIKVQDNTGALIKTFGGPFTFKAGANCTPSVAGSIFTFNCSGGAAAATFFQPNADRNTTQGFNIDNTRTSAFYLDHVISVSKFHMSIATVDGTGLYSVGLFDTSGTRVAHCNPAHLTADVGSPSGKDWSQAFVEGLITINPGIYWTVITGNANTGLLESSSGNALITPGSESFLGAATVGGAQPASITPPATKFVIGQVYYLALHQ